MKTNEEKDTVDTIKQLKAIRIIDGLNEGLLIIILALLIGFIGLLLTIGFTLLPYIFSEAYFIEHNMSGDAFHSFMGTIRDISVGCFNILLFVFALRCLVKPVYLALSTFSKRKVVKND